MGTPGRKKAAVPRRPSPAGKLPAGGRTRRQQTRAAESAVTERDEDIEAQRHEIHGMIEDAMEPPPERGGTDVERE